MLLNRQVRNGIIGTCLVVALAPAAFVAQEPTRRRVRGSTR